MQDILFNLALIDLTNFCYKEHNIVTPNGSHLIKEGRGFRYSLIDDATGEAIATVVFNKHSVPSHYLWKKA